MRKIKGLFSCDNNKNQVGISAIKIVSSDENEYIVGEW